MRERTNIQLSAADRNELESVVANRNGPQKQWQTMALLLTLIQAILAEVANRETRQLLRYFWS
jgi:hypothetical protein